MFDDSGTLVLPKGVFNNVEISKSEWRVECPHCGHIIRMKAKRESTRCRKCRQVIVL